MTCNAWKAAFSSVYFANVCGIGTLSKLLSMTERMEWKSLSPTQPD